MSDIINADIIENNDFVLIDIINNNDEITIEVSEAIKGDPGAKGDKGDPGETEDIYEHSTGVVWGLGLQAHSGSNSLFDILPGEAIFIDNFTVPGTTTRTELPLLSGITGIEPVWGNPGRHPIYITLNSSGTVIQSLTAPSLADLTRYAYIGVISVNPDTETIASIYPYTFGASNSVTRFEQFAVSLGTFNLEGNVYAPAVATPTLSLSRSAGKIYRLGNNASTDPRVPDVVTTTSASPETFMSTRHVSGSWSYVPRTVVDPENYDNLTDLEIMTPNYWQIKTLFYSPSIVFFQYGQKQYSTLTEAENHLFEPFEIFPILKGDFVFRGWLITQQGCSDLNDTAKAKFISAGKFGLDSPGGTTSSNAVGNDKEISFNDAGIQTGNSNLRFDKNSNSLIIGIPESLPNNPLNIGRAVNGWLQANIQNTNEGLEASADWVATADNGSDDANYNDIGINSGIYSSEDYPFMEPNDAYIQCESNRLLINTLRLNTDIHFLTGGCDTENERMKIDNTGITINEGHTLKIGSLNLSPSIFGTGSEPLPTGLPEGTIYFKYEN